jgi:hypothetical protein
MADKTNGNKSGSAASTAYGEATVNGLLKKEEQEGNGGNAIPSVPEEWGVSKEDVQLVLQSFRVLIA